MQKQNEITEKTNLLDRSGHVQNPGYCKRNLYVYNREDIAAPVVRIKEWDFYQVSDGRYLIQFTVANISFADAGVITVIDMETGKTLAMTAKPSVMTINKYPMPRNGDEPNVVERHWGKVFNLVIDNNDNKKHFTFDGYSMLPPGKKFNLDLTFEKMPGLESITTLLPCVPEDSDSKTLKNYFFFTQKQNSMPVSGTVDIGDTHISFDPSKTYGVMDWGRVVWPHDINWLWANGTTRLPDGKLFGFELTWGIGDDSNATETCIFYDGKAHKLGEVGVEYNPGDMMKPWHFHDNEGRFQMTMIPYFNNKTEAMVGTLGSNGYQLHGKWSGKAVLDDGTVLEIKDMDAFCERVHNKW